jgi:hypothetical protein
MLLLSENLPPPPPPGPVFTKSYPELDQDILSNSECFTQGQPFDLFARMRSQAPVGVAARGVPRRRFLGADAL